MDGVISYGSETGARGLQPQGTASVDRVDRGTDEVIAPGAASMAAQGTFDSVEAYALPSMVGLVVARPAGDDRLVRLVQVLQSAGLSMEDAWQVAYHGLDADRARELLHLGLLQPRMEHYGASLVTLRILSEAIEVGALSGARVRQLFDAFRDAVVVRPDGVLAHVVGGAAIEQRRDLGLGTTYQLRQGILRELRPDGEVGEIVAELGLQRGPVGAALDGVTEAVVDGVLGLAQLTVDLYERPEETIVAAVDGFGRLPTTLAELIRKSPALYEQFSQLPEDDRVQAVANWLTTALLVVQGGAGIVSGGARASGAISGLGMVELVGGGQVLVGGVEAASLGWLGTQVALTAVLMCAAAADGPGAPVQADAKTRWKAADRADRAFGDLSDRSMYSTRDLGDVLDRADKMDAAAQLEVRRRITARLIEDASALPLAELADLTRVASRLGEEFAAELNAAVNARMKSEVQAILELPNDSRRTRAIRALRSAVDEAGIDLRVALRRGGLVPPLESLSPGARRAIQKLDAGATEVTVASKAEALEVLSQYPVLVDTSNWGWEMIKGLLPGKPAQNTFHWDDVFGPDGVLLHHHRARREHARTPHLQLEFKNESRHIFFSEAK
ncbi:MAG: hypothetical protein IPG45_30210 [Deltaproteobacteria bacterium]|nr:hypothetical protein [Deltaproteobacteria bacterium]